jgi:DNA-binding MarR family transcriptional regulator
MTSDQRSIDARQLFQRNPSPLARCKIAAGKNGPAGELLHQLIYRFQHKDALIDREGELWVAQAVRCWKEELAMSDHQFAKAIERLVNLGLVEKRAWALSRHNPVRITHLRLTEKGRTLLQGSPHSREVSERALARSDNPSRSIVDLSTPENFGNRLPGRGHSKEEHKSQERNRRRKGSGGALSQELIRQESIREAAEVRGFDEAVASLHLDTSNQFLTGLAALVKEASDRSSTPTVGFRGTARAAYAELLECMHDRARVTFQRGGKLPILPQEALVVAISNWAEFRDRHMSERDSWPYDFVPQFAVYKAELLYDFAVTKKNAPAPDEFIRKLRVV